MGSQLVHGTVKYEVRLALALTFPGWLQVNTAKISIVRTKTIAAAFNRDPTPPIIIRESSGEFLSLSTL
jgi:hypothetical protein